MSFTALGFCLDLLSSVHAQVFLVPALVASPAVPDLKNNVLASVVCAQLCPNWMSAMHSVLDCFWRQLRNFRIRSGEKHISSILIAVLAVLLGSIQKCGFWLWKPHVAGDLVILRTISSSMNLLIYEDHLEKLFSTERETEISGPLQKFCRLHERSSRWLHPNKERLPKTTRGYLLARLIVTRKGIFNFDWFVSVVLYFPFNRLLVIFITILIVALS